jgi:hypothetical protein
MSSTKLIASIVVAVVVVMIIAFALTTIQQNRSAKAAQCAQMLGQINQEKSSWWARNFDTNQINQQVDQYNGMCGSGPTDYAVQ